ncbi:ATPase domain-containing protein [Methanolobus sp. ZRKC2]|uniref:RAD55 family ATPase n=1 Tax=Methanolobus sp. ZRKC2 TaxID=3125783 RepID=UPI003249E44B
MRSSSFIRGLDEVLDGGFIRPSTILIAGSAGSGKTNICLQSLFEAAKNGEDCVYISLLSESKMKIIRSLSSFSFFSEDVIDSGKLRICPISSDTISKGDFSIFEYMNEHVLSSSPSRVVIDPITILADIDSTFEERQFRGCELRTFVQNLFYEFEEKEIILMVTGEIPEENITSSAWSYMVDTILQLKRKKDRKNVHRYIEIIKTRGSNFVAGEHLFRIDPHGISLIRNCK